MQEKLTRFRTGQVWDLVSRLENKTIVKKLDNKRTIVRKETRLVAHGFNQMKGSDYDEIYIFVIRLE